MNKILILSALSLLLVGCVNPQSRYRQSEMLGDQEITFPYKAQMTGMITLTAKSHCDEAEFMFYARTKESAHKVINIVTKETCQSEGGTSIENCTCEYSGIGIRYVPVDGSMPDISANTEERLEEAPQSMSDTKRTKIMLNSYPQGAVITINGKEMSTRTPAGMGFKPGKYNVMFALDGFKSDTTFVVEENQPDLEIYMNLQ